MRVSAGRRGCSLSASRRRAGNSAPAEDVRIGCGDLSEIVVDVSVCVGHFQRRVVPTRVCKPRRYPHFGPAAERRQHLAAGVSPQNRFQTDPEPRSGGSRGACRLLPPLRGSGDRNDYSLRAYARSYTLPSLRDSRNVGNDEVYKHVLDFRAARRRSVVVPPSKVHSYVMPSPPAALQERLPSIGRTGPRDNQDRSLEQNVC